MNCPYSNKVVLTRSAAVRAVAYWRRRGERMDFYPCAACDGWHVGHMALRAPRRRARR